MGLHNFLVKSSTFSSERHITAKIMITLMIAKTDSIAASKRGKKKRVREKIGWNQIIST